MPEKFIKWFMSESGSDKGNLSSMKVVLVGDGGSEKTAFAYCWKNDAPPDPHGYVPTVFENYKKKVRVGDQKVNFRFGIRLGKRS